MRLKQIKWRRWMGALDCFHAQVGPFDMTICSYCVEINVKTKDGFVNIHRERCVSVEHGKRKATQWLKKQIGRVVE